MGRRTRELSTGYDPTIIVYFEGREDLRAFKEWLRGAPGADDPPVSPQEANGCEGVVLLVRAAAAAPGTPPTFGVVDRDSLISSHQLKQHKVHAVERFLIADDAELRAQSPFPDRVYVLERWEVENCTLADLDVLWEESEHASRAPDSLNDFVTAMLRECERLLPISAALLHQRAECAASIDQQFALNRGTASEVEHDLCQSVPWARQALATYLPRLAAFDVPRGEPRERYDRLLRVVDGKRLMDRYVRAFTNWKVGESTRRELLGRLAERQWSRGRTDPVIVRVLASIRERGAATLTGSSGATG